MARIHYYVHGRGRGHATRSRAIIGRLGDEGYEVTAFAGLGVESLLRNDVPTHRVRSIVPSMGAELPRVLGRRVLDAVRMVGEERADLVISDGDLPGVLAARITHRPSIAVGHGLVFYCCMRPAELPADRWRREAYKARLSTMGATRRIAVNFVPLPVHRGRLARPDLVLQPAFDRPGDAPLVCYFRDGAPRALLQHLGSFDGPVILFAPRDPGVPGVEHAPLSRDRFLVVQRTARAMIATAGSQLISECIAWGIPLLALHAPDDDEQTLNVAMLRRAGLGDGLPIDRFDPSRLRLFLSTPPPRIPTWNAPAVSTVVLEEAAALLGGAR